MKLVELYQDKVWGTISGLDRIRFRGTLRWLASVRGLTAMMGHLGILLKEFGGWVDGMTAKVQASCASQAEVLGIPVRYLSSGGVDKERLARQIAEERGVTTVNQPKEFKVFRRPRPVPNDERRQNVSRSESLANSRLPVADVLGQRGKCIERIPKRSVMRLALSRVASLG